MSVVPRMSPRWPGKQINSWLDHTIRPPALGAEPRSDGADRLSDPLDASRVCAANRFDNSEASWMPKKTIPVMTRPKQKMGIMEVAISVVFLVCDRPRQENDTQTGRFQRFSHRH